MSFPRFDIDVPPSGYAWWYIDALSDDCTQALTIIVFVGSVFSPYYHHARRFSPAGAEPHNHSAVNVALYGKRARWAMTERGQADVSRRRDRLIIGKSAALWDGKRLTIDIDERSAPIPRRILGRVVVTPYALTEAPYALDAEGRHLWHPISPQGRIDVQFRNPAVSWQGLAYCDHNRGARPLEDDFRTWQWSRRNTVSDTAIDYDVVRSDGTRHCLSLTMDAERKRLRQAAPLPQHRLPKAPIWRMPRAVRSRHAAKITRTLEDTPFYARSEIAVCDNEQTAYGVHESLSLEKFSTGWVRTLLRFRMPRVSRSVQTEKARPAPPDDV